MPSDRHLKHRAAVAGKMFEAFVFAPIGAGAKLVTDGPAAVARARQELSNARFIGQMVVGQGASQLKDRIAAQQAAQAARSNVDAHHGSEPAAEQVAVGEADEAAAHVGEPTGDDVGLDLLPDSLGIPDYDSLPAIDIVGQLESLNPAELSAVDAYERSHRRRRTVLGKISQLSAES